MTVSTDILAPRHPKTITAQWLHRTIIDMDILSGRGGNLNRHHRHHQVILSQFSSRSTAASVTISPSMKTLGIPPP